MADPRTIIVPLTSPGQTATYRLAPGVTQYIQSVVATVDTSASGDVTPVLTISEQSGVVVGDKQQTNAIAGGGSGRATWALGLADEIAVSGYIRYHVHNVGDLLNIETNGGSGANPEEVQFTLVNGGYRIDATNATRGQFIVNTRYVNLLTTHAQIQMADNGDIDILAQAGGVLTTLGTQVTIEGDTRIYIVADNGDVFLQPGTGKTFSVLDHNGNPKIRWTEGTTDLHLPTGGSIVFDL